MLAPKPIQSFFLMRFAVCKGPLKATRERLQEEYRNEKNDMIMEHDSRIRDPCRLLIGSTHFLRKTVARKRRFLVTLWVRYDITMCSHPPGPKKP